MEYIRKYMCRPRISVYALPLDDELAFYLKKIYFFRK